ncbi:MAG: hypothetical protein WKG01_36555 [Kofleriaceae bacterium]
MTKSKPASATSPETGAAPEPVTAVGPGDDDDAEADKPAKRRKGNNVVEIELEISRQRAAGWVVFGVVLGSLMIWKLGTVGVWAGVVLVLVGLYRGWQLIQTFINPPGTIRVTEREVSLPRGLCLPRPITVEPAAVTAVYFLRKSVPWSRAAPVLVVELGKKAMLFPRDWFASEADQRHVVHALLRGRKDDGDGDGDGDDETLPAAEPA